jgi:hypothetical protein
MNWGFHPNSLVSRLDLAVPVPPITADRLITINACGQAQ